ncbi:putative protease Do-like 14 [Hordeum vulgare]|nr:putative protease Do-like 14 [Hordeum vulgare]
MFEWGKFILAPRRGRGVGRGSRNNSGRGRDEHPFDPTYTGRETEEEVGGGSHGRGRGQDWRDSANWRYNSVYNRPTGEGMTGTIHVPVGETVMREKEDNLGLDVTNTRMIMVMDSNVLGKRYAADSGLAAIGNVDDIPHVAGGIMVPAGNTATKVDIFVGGFEHNLLRGSIGAIIRDHKGQFLAAANDKIDICYDSNTAEALAVRFGLNLLTATWKDFMDVLQVRDEGLTNAVGLRPHAKAQAAPKEKLLPYPPVMHTPTGEATWTKTFLGAEFVAPDWVRHEPIKLRQKDK